MKFVRTLAVIFAIQLAQSAHGQIAVSGTVVSDETGSTRPSHSTTRSISEAAIHRSTRARTSSRGPTSPVYRTSYGSSRLIGPGLSARD